MKPLLRMVALAAFALSLLNCSTSHAADPVCTEQPNFQRYFDEAGMHGTLVLYNPRQKKMECFNGKRADSCYTPASTFKIFNSLVALETGAVKSETDTLKWDGVKRSYEAWNKSQDMREAMKNSTVWFYQEIARRVGREKMQRYIDAANYGNGDISGPIDMFWLTGKFCISAHEQIAFLEKLYNNDVPFSKRSIDIVKDIMINERAGDAVLRAKTGWGTVKTDKDEQDIGWWVGYVEKGDDVWFFALNIDMKSGDDAAKRKTIVRRILADKGIFPLTD